MNARILNRNSAPPQDGWYQIEVNGTWPAGTWPDGRARSQVIDDQAVRSIVNRFQEDKAAAGENWAGMLVDLDHLSHDVEKSTEAWAWLQEVQIRNNQLWGRLDLTDLGEPAIRNKRVKWFSTEYDPQDLEDLGDGRVRPLRLAGLAFTNRPNNRGGKPISNRAGEEPGGEQTNQTTPPKPMKTIAEKLGLPADADEAAILNAIAALQSKVADQEAKQADADAEAILNTKGKNIPAAARPHWKEQLIKNRAETEKLIAESFPENPTRTAPERIHNRDTANSPAPVGGEENKEAKAAEAKAAAIRNRAHVIVKERGLRFGAAFKAATAELS